MGFPHHDIPASVDFASVNHRQDAPWVGALAVEFGNEPGTFRGARRKVSYRLVWGEGH